MANFNLEDYTSDAVTFRITGLAIGDTVRFFVRLYSDTSDVTVDRTYSATSSTMTKTFTGLKPNTRYAYNFWHNGTIVYSSGPSFTTEKAVEVTRPRDWAWYSTIRSGGTVRLSASEWNAFCTRINEFREYKGLSNYNFTTVYRGDDISANIVNQARSAIYSMNRNVPSSAVSGGTMYASFFTGLSDALNSIS